ncbi:unnamed protein product [Caenorhabditis sp. 36 PRJEB53466]|nr:unnamed protein product [Caenorhabditis sp. 36 PRJEB53466]
MKYFQSYIMQSLWPYNTNGNNINNFRHITWDRYYVNEHYDKHVNSIYRQGSWNKLTTKQRNSNKRLNNYRHVDLRTSVRTSSAVRGCNFYANNIAMCD